MLALTKQQILRRWDNVPDEIRDALASEHVGVSLDKIVQGEHLPNDKYAAVAQIVHTPKFVVFLTETFHGFQIVPTDGRPHRDNIPPSHRGDAVGHWEEDTLVVDVRNFTDDTWIWAEGRVSFHSDQLRIVERYQRIDADTLVIDATIYDPAVLTAPWVVPTQTLQLAPFDQIMPLICSGTETQALMDAAAGTGEK